MSLITQSQDEFIINSLLETISYSFDQTETAYSQLVDFALQELTRMTMRSLAFNDSNHQANVLEDSINLIEQRLQECLINQPEFSLAPFRSSLQRSLKYSAKEISILGMQLQQTKQQQVFGQQELYTSESGIPYEVIQTGSHGAIEALIAIPQTDNFELNLDQIEESYELMGDWFPFEISVQELPILIDDDGSIFIYTANFPDSLILDAQATLVSLSNRIYC